MVAKSELTPAQQYAVEGLVNELTQDGGYIAPSYVIEKLNIIFSGKGRFKFEYAE